MSLVQHVSAVEGPDRVDLADLYEPVDNASLYTVTSLGAGRRLSLTLSYDPIQAGLPPTEKLEPVGAYKVSSAKRLAQVLAGVIICILASGIVFGFAALKEVLVAEQVYRDLCTKEELQRDERLCYMQDQRLNLNFIVGSATTNLSALVVGNLLDRYGPRFCGMLSCLFLFFGSLSMAFASSLPLDAYLIGFLFLALGGTFSFVPSFHLSNAFPQCQGLILALVTGAFDASAAVFLAFRLIYESTNGAFNLREFFLLYLIVPIIIFIANLALLPSRSFETRAELETQRERVADNTLDVHDSDDELDNAADIWRLRSARAEDRKKDAAQITDLIGSESQQISHELKEDDKKIASGVWGVLHGVPASKQMRTPWFALVALFTVLQMTRFNFFISTIWSQYDYMLNSAQKATEVTGFFNLALPIGGVATVPVIGLLLDGTSTVTVLSLLVLLSTVIGVLGAMPNITAAYLNVLLFVIFRPLYYSAMSDYAAKIFGFATFGRVYGMIICLSGLSLFSQPALQALVHAVYYEDPGPVNLWLAGIGLIVGLALVMYVDAQARQIRKTQFHFLAAHTSTMDVDDERRSLLSVGLGAPGAISRSGTTRGRVDLRSPQSRPADMGHNNVVNLNSLMNASLFCNYGALNAEDSTAEPRPASPYGSVRIRPSRQGLGAGLRTVAEGKEPPENQRPRSRRPKKPQAEHTPASQETAEGGTTESDPTTETESEEEREGREDGASEVDGRARRTGR